MESNWTSPALFMLYSIVRPLAGVGIVVFMYIAVSTAANLNDPSRLAFVFVGSTAFMFVGQELYGISQAVLEDREHYRTLKYVYIAPSSIYAYLVGRGLARVAETGISATVALVVGALVLHIDYSHLDVPLLIVAVLLGVLGIATFGIMLAGITLLTARHGFQMGESVAALFFFLGGVVFPIHILPAWVQPVSYALPVTYWVEAVRRSLIGPAGQADSFLASLPTGTLLLLIAGTTALFFVLSVVVFRQFDRAARRKGRIDITTSF
jgi:ABC-2 type transport system permease protein